MSSLYPFLRKSVTYSQVSPPSVDILKNTASDDASRSYLCQNLRAGTSISVGMSYAGVMIPKSTSVSGAAPPSALVPFLPSVSKKKLNPLSRSKN